LLDLDGTVADSAPGIIDTLKHNVFDLGYNRRSSCSTSYSNHKSYF
jgi:hypothetical protein